MNGMERKRRKEERSWDREGILYLCLGASGCLSEWLFTGFWLFLGRRWFIAEVNREALPGMPSGIEVEPWYGLLDWVIVALLYCEWNALWLTMALYLPHKKTMPRGECWLHDDSLTIEVIEVTSEWQGEYKEIGTHVSEKGREWVVLIHFTICTHHTHVWFDSKDDDLVLQLDLW